MPFSKKEKKINETLDFTFFSSRDGQPRELFRESFFFL